ncbi:hypothetical protein I7I50_01333 [Histoplasma capsulatum G186AR]|uniref:Uncharacterized protein n=1 Tax=Ajellomyces capsulatus TaxID=5037 RepID=A0A8H7YAH3_AJECA|nr:hypothetical protein I7I52_12449 [Histoplasma capsulatum]QSS73237.1 hypothetical protein I7I50_01333 [Histoplasma capsulatum G186AR]
MLLQIQIHQPRNGGHLRGKMLSQLTIIINFVHDTIRVSEKGHMFYGIKLRYTLDFPPPKLLFPQHHFNIRAEGKSTKHGSS